MTLKNLFKLFAPVQVEWDDTDLPYTANGPRREGTFTARTHVGAWLWATAWTILHPRAAVFIKGVE